MMSLEIARAQSSQVDALCAIERETVQLFRGHSAWEFYSAMAIPPELLQQAVSRGLVWVAQSAGGVPLGFVWLDTAAGGSVIGIAEMNVSPEHGRRGIGAALLGHACAWAREAGYRRVDLGTLADVPWNAPFYAQHGVCLRTPTRSRQRLSRCTARVHESVAVRAVPR
jgi:4-diphosphocytidyl-2-C-methyl-D-erythritol kinase